MGDEEGEGKADEEPEEEQEASFHRACFGCGIRMLCVTLDPKIGKPFPTGL